MGFTNIYMSPITKNNYDRKIQKIIKILLQNLYKLMWQLI